MRIDHCAEISAHLRRKSAIYISALYMLRYSLVCSVAPRKNFGALTTAPKFQLNGSAETSSTTDVFFQSGRDRSGLARSGVVDLTNPHFHLFPLM